MKNIIILLLLLIMTSCEFNEKRTVLKSNLISNKEVLDDDEVISKPDLVDAVLAQLDIKRENCKNNLIAVKELPNSNGMSIVVIPEISAEDEEDYFFELNSYILIVNSETGKIKSKFYESSKTNEWTSDALVLTGITIDTAPYNVQKDKRAFGVRVHYLGSSKPNPYENETISLFVEDGGELRRVLNKYEINGNFGEWDTSCAGQFTSFNSVLIMTNVVVNNYYNIDVKTTTIETNSFEDEKGDCQSVDKRSIHKGKLIFNGKEYERM